MEELKASIKDALAKSLVEHYPLGVKAMEPLSVEEMVFTLARNDYPKWMRIFKEEDKERFKAAKAVQTVNYNNIIHAHLQPFVNAILGTKNGNVGEAALKMILGGAYDTVRVRKEVPPPKYDRLDAERFNRYVNSGGEAEKKRHIIADGRLCRDVGELRKGIVECKYFSPNMTGTANEKNECIPSKYARYPHEDGAWTTAILCGKVDDEINRRLVIASFKYRRYLADPDISLTEYERYEFARWKKCRFAGYFLFNEVLEMCESGIASETTGDDVSVRDGESEGEAESDIKLEDDDSTTYLRGGSMPAPIKWAGGKGNLGHVILPILERQGASATSEKRYVDLFCGSLALPLAFRPRRALFNDVNEGLINLYEVIRDHHEPLLLELAELNQAEKNSAAAFNAMRDEFNMVKKTDYRSNPESKVRMAALFVYLNKRGFNGLYRENRHGDFNVPYRNNKGGIFSPAVIGDLHTYFSENDITFSCRPYHELLDELGPDDVVYMDPPYYPSDTSKFVGYSARGFGPEDQVKLRDFCDTLHARGIQFVASNAPCDAVRELYGAYRQQEVRVGRNMRNAKKKDEAAAPKDRDAANEIVMWNE